MEKKVSGLQICFFCGILFILLLSWNTDKKTTGEFYKLTIYHFKNAEQEKILDNYFQNALLPSLHRLKINNVGVFKSWANDTVTDKLIYVLIPASSLEWIVKLPDELKKDAAYSSAASEYLDAAYNNPPYARIETILLKAFPLAPQMKLPGLHADKKERVYELRSYESPTEKKFENKMQMFNQGDEIGLFKKLNFNAIFYSEVIAGSKMPNLMYMTSFENKADREEHWKTFVNDPYWKKLSAMPEYLNNVSHIDITFLYPANYSDF
ncbi:MAG: NIPSNAP family protein [Chitinophagales bacterium]